MPRLSEDALIATYFAPLAGAGGLRLADDAALLCPRPGEDLVLTKDMLVAGVHFFPEDLAGAIAKKALRVNLSDLAAKGAVPRGFLLGLGLPQDWQEDWIAAFASGLAEDASLFGIDLLGGDTVHVPGPLTLSITAIGGVPEGTMVPRGGAKTGDHIFVTGTIGDAALGLKIRKTAAGGGAWTTGLSPEGRAHLCDRYLLPQPRLALRDALRHHARTAMDISDGLAGDLAKFLHLGGMSASIAASKIPLSRAARAALSTEPSLLETILCGGDDYEILCTVAAESCVGFIASAEAAGVPVTDIGTCVPGDAPPVFIDEEGRPLTLAVPSFQHF